MIWTIFPVSLAVFVLSVAALAILLRSGWAWRLAVDTPNDRSLHSKITPRVGGLGFMPWAIVAGVLFGDAPVVFLAALALAALSYGDDRFGLPIGLRFGAHLLLALLVTITLLPSGVPGWLVALLVFAVVWMTNLYNFMDGADGLAGGMAAIGFAVYAAAALMAGGNDGLAVAAGGLSAAACGFLVFNFPPARVFMGDAGSVPLGFLAATLGIQGWATGAWPAWFPILAFLPFIADASVTLCRRLLRGERFWQAHREHAYQKLVRAGWSHRQLAVAAYGLMAGTALSALWLIGQAPALVAAACAAWMIALLVIFGVVERFWRRQA